MRSVGCRGGWRCWLSTLCLAVAAAGAVADELKTELPGIEVLQQRIQGIPIVSLRNPELCEMTVSLQFVLENLTSTVNVPFQIVLAPQHTTPPLVGLRPTNPAKPWHFTYQSFFTWGTPYAHQATNQLYVLPFAPGRSFPVVQGHDGAFSHTGEDRYAIDFGMPEGTPVMAARGGLVVMVRDGFDSGAPDIAYKKQANQIFIRHEDATLGEYLHLLKGGMKVKTGDRVPAGQVIGLSGNSGYSRGPHLHFMVFRAKDSKSRESLPVRFLAREGSGIVLEQGKSYTSVPFTEPTHLTERPAR